MTASHIGMSNEEFLNNVIFRRMKGNIKTPSEKTEQAKQDQILKDNSSALSYLRDTLKKNNSLIGEMNLVSKASHKVFKSVVDSSKNYKELEKLPHNFKVALDKSGVSLVKAFAANINSLEGMFEAQTKIERLPHVKNALQQLAEGTTTVDQFRASLTQFGYTTEETDIILNRFNSGIFESNGYIKNHKSALAHANFVVRQFDKDIRAANEGVSRFGNSVDDQRKSLKDIIGLVKNSLVGLFIKEMFDAAQASMRFGAELSLVQSRLAGFSPEEYAQVQANNRQAINALTDNFNEFNGYISKSNYEMVQYTGSLKDSSLLIANLVTTSRLLGSAAVDTNAFVESQKNVFRVFSRTLSMTSQEFSAMNERLIQDNDIRTILYKQSEKEREAHFAGLQQQILTFRSWGMLQEQAEKLAKSMDRISGKGAKDRLKESARLRAIMGAIGLGSEGTEIQRLMLKGPRASEEEKTKLAALLTSAQEKVGARMGQSFQSELLMDAMIGKADLAEYLGPQSVMVDAILGKGAKSKKPEKDPVLDWMKTVTLGMESGPDIVNAIVTFKETIISFLGSQFISTFAGVLAAQMALSKLGGLGGALGSAGTTIASTLSNVANMLKLAIPTATATTGVVGAMGMFGKDVYDYSIKGERTNENAYAMGGSVVGGLLGGAISGLFTGGLGTAVGASVGVMIGNTAGEQLGKWMDYLETGKTKSDEEIVSAIKESQVAFERAITNLQEATQTGTKEQIDIARNIALNAQNTLEQSKAQLHNSQSMLEEQKKANTKGRQISIHEARSTPSPVSP